MANRRRFLQGLSGLPVLGGLSFAAKTAGGGRRDYFRELGLRPFINAAGTFTTLSASLMQPEVVQAIEYASKQFVKLTDMQDACGAKIAQLVGVKISIASKTTN